jgi:hypothetical protein
MYSLKGFWDHASTDLSYTSAFGTIIEELWHDAREHNRGGRRGGLRLRGGGQGHSLVGRGPAVHEGEGGGARRKLACRLEARDRNEGRAQGAPRRAALAPWRSTTTRAGLQPVFLGGLFSESAQPSTAPWSDGWRVNSSATVGAEPVSTQRYSVDRNPLTYRDLPHT